MILLILLKIMKKLNIFIMIIILLEVKEDIAEVL